MKANLFIKQIFGTTLFFTIIFVSAGRLFYWQGLIYLCIGLLMIGLNYSVFRPDPDLEKERSKPGKGAKKWDRLILLISFLSTIGMFVSAGLDSGRYHWTSEFQWYVYAIGILLTITGQVLFLIAQKQNKFFSSIVRIQTDRGHIVCETGLYKIVRHPAYLGSIIQALGFPLLFGSLWSTIPASLSIILLIIRTYLEDQTLKNELQGYAEFAKKTPYRLIPLIW